MLNGRDLHAQSRCRLILPQISCRSLRFPRLTFSRFLHRTSSFWPCWSPCGDCVLCHLQSPNGHRSQQCTAPNKERPDRLRLQMARWGSRWRGKFSRGHQLPLHCGSRLEESRRHWSHPTNRTNSCRLTTWNCTRSCCPWRLVPQSSRATTDSSFQVLQPKHRVLDIIRTPGDIQYPVFGLKDCLRGSGQENLTPDGLFFGKW